MECPHFVLIIKIHSVETPIIHSYSNSRMLRHSCCEVRVMQLHDILQLRTSVILPEAISDGGLAPTTDTSLFLTTYRGGSHLPSDIITTLTSLSSGNTVTTFRNHTPDFCILVSIPFFYRNRNK